MAEICIVIDELRWHNQTLEDDIHNIKQHRQEINPPKEMELLDSLPLSNEIWGSLDPEGFKPLSLIKFDGRRDPYEHVSSINTQMAIVEASNSLKCKMFLGTLRDSSLIWYMDLSHSSSNNYQELVH